MHLIHNIINASDELKLLQRHLLSHNKTQHLSRCNIENACGASLNKAPSRKEVCANLATCLFPIHVERKCYITNAPEMWSLSPHETVRTTKGRTATGKKEHPIILDTTATRTMQPNIHVQTIELNTNSVARSVQQMIPISNIQNKIRRRTR